MKLRNLKSLAGWTLALILFICSSCEQSEKDSSFIPTLQLKKNEVEANAGEQFISVSAEGPWTLQLFFGDLEPWAKLSAESGVGSKNNIILSCEENTSETPRSLEVYLLANNKEVIQKLSQKGNNGQSVDPDQPVDPNPNKPENFGIKASWLELPDMSNKSLDYIAHYYENNDKKYRNYSIGYSEKDVLSIWVAYPLCHSHFGTLSRHESWAYDPVLKYKSPAPFAGYAGNMDRGHMLPSNSRSNCLAAMAQTYYGSNITPQIGAKFNQGIWQELEFRIKGKAKEIIGKDTNGKPVYKVDTLYIVTGCIVKGSTQKTLEGRYRPENLFNPQDNPTRKEITVPVGFYKAILSYKKFPNGKESYNMIGYYLDHKSYSSRNIEDSMRITIDELEKKTGLDFYPNLEKKIGREKAEALEKGMSADLYL